MKKINDGFSLIELIITVAVIGILAAVAIPSYTEYVYKAKRSLANQLAVECASTLERRYTLVSTYSTTDCDSITDDEFVITIVVDGLDRGSRNCDANGRKNCFSVNITPASDGGPTGDSSCQSYSLTEQGTKSSLDSSSKDSTDVCWRS